MFWFVFLFPGKPGYLLPWETPPSRTRVAGMPGCRRPAEPRGVREALPAPSPRPAEVALLSAAATRQGRGSAA